MYVSKICVGARIFEAIIHFDSACLSIQREWFDVPVSPLFLPQEFIPFVKEQLP